MSRLVAAFALTLALGGCVVGTVGGPRALPEITGMLTFAAYPGGKVVAESGSTENISFTDRPGRYATRTYETSDNRQAVRTHYEQLAAKNGWSISPAQSPDPDYGYSYSSGLEIARLSRDKYNISIYEESTRYSSGNTSTPPGDYPTPPPSASPSPGPYRFRVEASAY